MQTCICLSNMLFQIIVEALRCGEAMKKDKINVEFNRVEWRETVHATDHENFRG